MNRMMKRQLRRAFELESVDDIDSRLAELRALCAGGAPQPGGLDAQAIARAFLSLTDAAEASYSQLERDLELRTLSLDVSSAELFEANQRLRADIDLRQAAVTALLTTANELARDSGFEQISAENASLTALSQFINQLTEARKLALRTQQESESRLRLALGASQLSMWDWEVGQSDIFLDDYWVTISGQENMRNHVSMSEIGRLIHRADFDEFIARLKATIKGETASFSMDHRIRQPTGRWIWVRTFGKVTERSADGRARRMTGTNVDITSSKFMEQSLAHNLKLLETLLEAMPLPIIIKDEAGIVQRVNAAWERLRGEARSRQIGFRIHARSDAELDAQCRRTDMLVIDESQTLQYESRIAAADGREHEVLISKAPLPGIDGSVEGIISVVTDITQQKRVEAELLLAKKGAEQAAVAKSRFLANMSHELRTPLNGVVGMASLLHASELNPQQSRHVEALRSSAEALITIINDILDLSKIEAGKLDITPSPVALENELDQIVNLYGARALDKGLTLGCHLAPDVPSSFVTDPLRLRQVLGNLLSNAIKFTERGEVILSARIEADTTGSARLRFDIADTGIGIPEAHQRRVFDAFSQADDSITKRFGGTGLGLAICRQLVELLGGQLQLSSVAGEGSRFWFSLPFAEAQAEPTRPLVTPRSGALIICPPSMLRAALADTAAAHCDWVAAYPDAQALSGALDSMPAQLTQLQLVVHADAPGTLQQAADLIRLQHKNLLVEPVLLATNANVAAPAASGTALRIMISPIFARDIFGASQRERMREPAPAPAAVPSQSPLASETPTNGPNSRARILVAEDNAVNQHLMRAMLDHLQMDCVLAADGEIALQLFATQKFDLVLMDCQMPVLDGLGATRRIRELENGAQHTPIVALTGNAMPGDRENCLAAGMDDFLAKPINLETLASKLASWLTVPAPVPRARANTH